MHKPGVFNARVECVSSLLFRVSTCQVTQPARLHLASTEYRPTWELHLFGFIKISEVKRLNISKLINATAPRYFGKCIAGFARTCNGPGLGVKFCRLKIIAYL